MERATHTDHVTCPHCGFRNFAISAYCGRCERPLRSEAPPDPASAPRAPTAPQRVRPPLAAVPPPEPPVALQKPAPTPLPIELPEGATRRARHRTRLGRPRTPPAPLTPGSVALPGSWRVLASWAVDLAVLFAATLVCAQLEILLRGDPPVGRTSDWLDFLAAWVATHPETARHAVVFAVFFTLVHSAWGARSGATLGRRVTGTVLVHTSGRVLSWPRVIARACAAVVSTLLFGGGYFWSLADSYRRPLHDVLFGTLVVQRKLRR